MLKLFLYKDGGVNATLEEMVIEEPAQEIPPEMKVKL